jgi:hypothetical protein
MNEVMKQLIQYMVAYGGLIALIFFVLNFLQKGFLLTYLRVKASQGKKVLVEVSSAIDEYYRPGQFKDGFFVFKNRAKEEKSIPIDEAAFKKFIKHSIGVPKICVDEAGNKIVDKNWDTHQALIDTGSINTILKRIKNRPQVKSKQEVLIILLLLGILAITALMFFRVMNIQQALEAITSLTGTV